MPIINIDQIKTCIGQEIGVSGWITISQDHINAFAEITGDRQFIHIDPEKAKATPFGGTVAHGFLTLSLLSQMAFEAALQPDGCQMVINYGFDRIRFLAPVRSGKRVRGRFILANVEEKQPSQWLLTHNVAVEIEGEEKPALIAEWALYFR